MSEQSFSGDHAPSVADGGFDNSPDITLPMGAMFSKCRWEDSSEADGRDCMKPLRPSVSSNIPSGSRNPSSLFKTRANEDIRHLDTLPTASRVGSKCVPRRHNSKASTEPSKSAGKQIATQAFNNSTQHFGESDTMDHETNFDSQPVPMLPDINLDYEPSDLAPDFRWFDGSDAVDQAPNPDFESTDLDRELQWSPCSTPQPKTESIYLCSQASSPWEELGDEISDDISEIHVGLEQDTLPETEHDPTEPDPKTWGDWLTDHPEDVWEDTPWEVEDEASFQDWMDQTRFPQWGPWSYYQEPRNWLETFSDNLSVSEHDDAEDPNWERWFADNRVGYWKPTPTEQGEHRHNYWATWGPEEEPADPVPGATAMEKMMRRSEIMTQYLDIHDQISLILSRPTKEEWEVEIEGYLRELSERIEQMLPQASSSETQEAHDSSALLSSPFVTDVGQSGASNDSGAEGDVASEDMSTFMHNWRILIGHDKGENERRT